MVFPFLSKLLTLSGLAYGAYEFYKNLKNKKQKQQETLDVQSGSLQNIPATTQEQINNLQNYISSTTKTNTGGVVKAKQNQALSANKVTAGKKSIINNKQLPVMQSPNLNYFQQALNISDEYLDSIKQQRDAALKASALDELRAAGFAVGSATKRGDTQAMKEKIIEDIRARAEKSRLEQIQAFAGQQQQALQNKQSILLSLGQLSGQQNLLGKSTGSNLGKNLGSGYGLKKQPQISQTNILSEEDVLGTDKKDSSSNLGLLISLAGSAFNIISKQKIPGVSTASNLLGNVSTFAGPIISIAEGKPLEAGIGFGLGAGTKRYNKAIPFIKNLFKIKK